MQRGAARRAAGSSARSSIHPARPGPAALGEPSLVGRMARSKSRHNRRMTAEANPGPPRVHRRHGELKGVSYELFILGVTLVSVINLVLLVLPLGGTTGQVALVMELCLAPIFLVDFIYRLATAASRREYLVRRWGWTDLLGAVPLLGVLRLVRFARSFSLLRRMDPQDRVQELF